MTDICRQIRSRRHAGAVICKIFRDTEIESRKNTLEKLGFTDLPEKHWKSVDRETARDLLIGWLHKDIAYNGKLMSRFAAEYLAKTFLGQFPLDATYVTNVTTFGQTDDARGATAWSGISDCTFDMGVIVETDGVLGILWFLEED